MADINNQELARQATLNAVGRTDFISRTQADTAERREAIDRIVDLIKAQNIK